MEVNRSYVSTRALPLTRGSSQWCWIAVIGDGTAYCNIRALEMFLITMATVTKVT